MIVYHISEYDKLESIQKHGLIPNRSSKYEHTGDGVYVFFDRDYAVTMQEYLNISDNLGRAILVTAECKESELLMDEDSLYIDDEKILPRLKLAIGEQAYQEYLQFLHNNDGADELPINNNDVAAFKTDLIDRYRIKPNKMFKTEFGHYSILTARCVGKLDIINIQGIYDGEIMDLNVLSAYLAMFDDESAAGG